MRCVWISFLTLSYLLRAVIRAVRLEKVIGKGGFGLVWKGVLGTEQVVAVKELASADAQDTPEKIFQFLSFQKEVCNLLMFSLCSSLHMQRSTSTGYLSL